MYFCRQTGVQVILKDNWCMKILCKVILWTRRAVLPSAVILLQITQFLTIHIVLGIFCIVLFNSYCDRNLAIVSQKYLVNNNMFNLPLVCRLSVKFWKLLEVSSLLEIYCHLGWCTMIELYWKKYMYVLKKYKNA